MTSSPLLKILLPLTTSLLFAGSFIAGKYTTQDLTPILTALLRYIVALLFLSGLCFHYRWKTLKIDPKDLILLGLLGLFGIVGYHYFFFASLRYTAIANTAIINAANPIITGILAAIFIQERLKLTSYLGVGFAFVGVMTLLTQGQILNLLYLRFNLGDVLMFIAVLCWVIYALLIKKLSAKYSGFTLTYYAALSGVLFLFILALFDQPIAQLRQISAASYWSILYMGIGASGLGYLQYNLSITKIGATRTSSFVYSFVPVFVSILAFLFFGQSITMIMVMSAVFIIVGLNLMLRSE